MSGDDDFKDKRQKFSIEIRRQKREEALMKKRNLSQVEYITEKQPKQNILILDEYYYSEIEQFINSDYDDSMFQKLANCVNSVEIQLQHQGLIGLRKLLARNIDPPIKRFIDKGLLSKCLQMCKQNSFKHLKYQSAWILTNIASGDSKSCEKLVNKGGIDLFVILLQTNEIGIVDQAIWGIGNLAADNPVLRDIIIRKGGLEKLIKVVENSQNKLTIRNGAWAITNLCRGHPPPDFRLIKQACPSLCKVLKSDVLKDVNNKQILSDVIWALAFMTQGSKSRIQRVNKCVILSQIFSYSLENDQNVCVPALKIIGNFSNGNENHSEQLIKYGIFDLGIKILNNQKRSMRREMCWILSNLAAGVNEQVTKFMNNVNLLDKISSMFHNDVVDIKRQICWIYGNMGHLGDRIKLVDLLLQYDTMHVYANLLHQESTQTLQNVLDTLFKVLFVGGKCKQNYNNKNPLADKLGEYGGICQLQALQIHENKNVYGKVLKIMTKFFDVVQDSNI